MSNPNDLSIDATTTVRWAGWSHTITSHIEPVYSDEAEGALPDVLDRHKAAIEVLAKTSWEENH